MAQLRTRVPDRSRRDGAVEFSGRHRMTIWRPMLATAATVLNVHRGTYEMKWDGCRIIAVKDGARIHLISHNAKDLTRA